VKKYDSIINVDESNGVKKGLELEELAVEDFNAL